MPSWNFQSIGLWFYFIVMSAIVTGVYAVCEFFEGEEEYLFTKISASICAVIVVVMIIVSIFSWEIFRANDYKNIISVSEEGDFNKDIPKVKESKDIPIVDMLTAQKLGDRTMGEMEKYSSQYEVNDEYNLISYKGSFYRISPTEYDGFFKYLNSKERGIPGYVLVDIYTQEATFVKVDEGIKYSPSAHFDKLLKRHLRKNYPSYIFGKEQFEIDEQGVPFFIVPVYKTTIGLFGGYEVDRVILVNAISGETTEKALEDVPNWVDHVFSVSYLMEKLNWHYSYVNGFWNSSIFGPKKDVRKTSYSFDQNQYYFIAREDGIYLYNGITSAGKDESNYGFLLANVRTGEVKYYSNPGAEESSAQASAEGVVQQYGYKAGPVMLVNIDGIETYFMTLKDNQLLVKKVALVNKKNYTIAVVEDTIEQAINSYRDKFSIEERAELIEASGVISELYSAIKNGNTNYYFKLKNDNKLYVSSIVNNEQQVTMKIGDSISLKFVQVDEKLAIVEKIVIK
ncbi:hypothetical protein D3C72_1137630 [compost metagenome]